MPCIRLILEDDLGIPLPNFDQHLYQLQGDCDSLDRIEHTVEGFKKRTLPELERSLLQRANATSTVQGASLQVFPEQQLSALCLLSALRFMKRYISWTNSKLPLSKNTLRRIL